MFILAGLRCRQLCVLLLAGMHLCSRDALSARTGQLRSGSSNQTDARTGAVRDSSTWRQPLPGKASNAETDKSCPGETDKSCPGTAEERLHAARERARSLNGKLTMNWKDVRKKLLWAAGLADIMKTSHCFEDYNHVTAATMKEKAYDNKHNGSVQGMARGNSLGGVIRSGSLKEGTGFETDGSWCTCALQAPSDVAHVQFKSKAAFYLVWPPGYSKFALATEDGELLACGQPTGDLPRLWHRQENWRQIFSAGPARKIAEAAQQCSSATRNVLAGLCIFVFLMHRLL